jgi:hypothetical protein
MQKLSKELKNVPTDTSLVCSPANMALNRDQGLSVPSKVLIDNNPEVNLQQHRVGSDLRVLNTVYVLNKRGEPLMPTCPGKARRLLKNNKAKVVKAYPFTIQLCYSTGETKQEVVLGIDPGYSNIGFSCITKKKELISGIVVLENYMTKRLIERKMYRKHRRNKHHWYREARFNNRGIKKGWLAPSVKRRLETHVNLVKRIQKLLPIFQVNIEVAKFDIQKLENPDIQGKEYQQGNLYEYENNKVYILAREKGRCQLCGEEYNKSGWHLHHIIPRGEGGTDRPDNFALLHLKCHKKLHKQKLFNKLKKNKQYKAETFMSIIRRKIVEEIRKICDNVNITYGYETKVKRIKNKLKKLHNNDAFVIANGKNQTRCYDYIIEQKRHNNRCLQTNRKGFKPSIRRKRSIIQPKDIFWVDGKKYRVKTMFSYGKYVLFGDVKKREYFNIKKIEKYFNVNSWKFILLSNKLAGEKNK